MNSATRAWRESPGIHPIRACVRHTRPPRGTDRHMPDLRQLAKTLFAQNRPFRSLTGPVLSRSGVCRALQIRHPDIVIPFSRHSHALTLWANPDFNEEDFAFRRTCLRPGDLVLDVGANIGLESGVVIPGATHEEDAP